LGMVYGTLLWNDWVYHIKTISVVNSPVVPGRAPGLWRDAPEEKSSRRWRRWSLLGFSCLLSVCW
jgi:hypothetical protein